MTFQWTPGTKGLIRKDSLKIFEIDRVLSLKVFLSSIGLILEITVLFGTPRDLEILIIL